MINFNFEWQEAPGVKDEVLARTWARLEIESRQDQATQAISACISRSANSLQRGIHGTFFPLAEWIVENWWHLLNEPCRVSEFRGARVLPSSQQAWARRHCFVTATDGGAFPDMSMYRDGRDVVLKWLPDGPRAGHCPVRFIEEGELRLDPDRAREALYSVVAAVLERLADQHDDDTARLRTNWKAICESIKTDASVCSQAALLGIDPYDATQMTPDLADILETRLSRFSDDVRNDLLEVSDGERLAADLAWVENASRKGGVSLQETRAPVSTQDAGSVLAHERGYSRARLVRKELHLPPEPLLDLDEKLRQLYDGKSWKQVSLGAAPEEDSGIDALVGDGGGGVPNLVGQERSESSSRFRLARAVFLMPPGDSLQWHPRLVTHAYTFDQRASRAFAAELLVPAEALRRAVKGPPTSTMVERLADCFGVNTMVVEHQLANHGIGSVE